jgi:hypothetical protein
VDDPIGDWLDSAGSPDGFGLGGVGRMGVVFVWAKDSIRPSLGFRPGRLLSALYVQALMDLTGGIDLYKCERPGCGEYFARGGGKPHRRAGARYHSVTCLKAHRYSQQKEKGK